jgi:GWxTD domain-containing protein
MIQLQTGESPDPREWLSQVSYIISTDEKKEFEQLQSSEERADFIEDFWRARDLDPSTEQNEYREAYLDRIQYAHRRYGQRTDRARVYVVNGEPDQRLVYPEDNFEEGIGRNPNRQPIAGPSIGDPNRVQGSFPSISVNSPEAELWTYYHARGTESWRGPLEVLFMRVPPGDLSTLFAASHIRDRNIWARMLGNTSLFKGARTAPADFTIVYVGRPRFYDVRDFYHQILTQPLTFDPIEIARLTSEIRRPLGDLAENARLRRREFEKEVAASVYFDRFSASLDYWIFRSAERYVYVPVALSILGRELVGVKELVVVGDLKREGASSAHFMDSLQIEKFDESELRHEGVTYQSRFAVLPGQYVLDFHLLDRANGKYQRIQEPIVVPDLLDKGFSMSDLVLCADVSSVKKAKTEGRFRHSRDWLTYSDLNPLKADEYLLVPEPDSSFRRKDILTVFFEIYRPGLVKGRPNVEVRLKLFSKDREVASIEVENLGYLTEDELAKISYAHSLSLAQLSPGSYQVRVEARDLNTGLTIENEDHFEVM